VTKSSGRTKSKVEALRIACEGLQLARKRPFAYQAFGKHAMSAFWRKAVGDKPASLTPNLHAPVPRFIALGAPLLCTDVPFLRKVGNRMLASDAQRGERFRDPLLA
jgi:hypothetical protein